MNNYDWTPLHIACYNGDLTTVTRLLKIPLNIDEKDNYGCTALHRAVQSGFYVLVQTLLNKGADANIQNNAGNTPLHWALQWGYAKIINILIKYTDPSLENREGQLISNILKNKKFVEYTEIDDLA